MRLEATLQYVILRTYPGGKWCHSVCGGHGNAFQSKYPVIHHASKILEMSTITLVCLYLDAWNHVIFYLCFKSPKRFANLLSLWILWCVAGFLQHISSCKNKVWTLALLLLNWVFPTTCRSCWDMLRRVDLGWLSACIHVFMWTKNFKFTLTLVSGLHTWVMVRFRVRDRHKVSMVKVRVRS